MMKKAVPKKTLNVIEWMGGLSDTQIAILIRRFASIPPLNQHEVARIFNLSNERIRQLEEKAIKELNKILKQ